MNGYDDLDEQAVANLTGGTYSPEAQRMDRLRRAMEIGEMDSPAEQSWAGTEILRAMHRGRDMADFNVTGTQFNNNQPWKSEWERLKTLRDFATGDWGAGDSELKKKHDEDSARIAADIDAKWDAKLKERGQTGDSATRRARDMEKRAALDEFDYAEYEKNKNLVDSAWQRASETLTGWMPGTLRDDAAELLYDEDADALNALMESKKAWDEKSNSLRSAATPIAGNVAAYYAKRDEMNAANEELRRFLAENPDPAANPEYQRLAEKADKRRKAAEYRSALDHESAYKNYLRLAPLMSAQARDIVEQTLKDGGAPGIWFWDGGKQDKLMADLQTLGREEKNLVAAILYDFKTPGAQTSVREAANQFMQGIGKVGQSAGWEIGSWIQRLRLSDAEYQDWRESAAALQQATGYKPRKYDWWITGAVADTFTTLGYGAAMYGTGKLAGIVTESVGGLAGMAAGTTFRNGAFAAAEWAGRARAAGDFASMMLDAMNTFENRVAAEGGDVTSPGFLAQKAAVGFAYATVERISWEQLGRLAPVRRQQLALTFWRKLHGRGLAPTLYAMLKGTVTESGEEAIQGVMEEAFVECHLDKGGIDFRKIIRRGIEDFGESLGPMALMSGGAVARNVLTGNIRNIDQRELPALASVANSVIEKARQKKGWLATMDWEEWRRTLGQISRDYMERVGTRGNGVEYLARIGIDDKETRDAVSKAIETVWREIGNTRGMAGEEIAGAQAQAEADMEAAAGWGDAEMAAEAQDAMNAIPAESREQAAERREQRMQDFFGGRKAKSAAEVLAQMFPNLKIEGDGSRVLWKRTVKTKDGKEAEQTLEIRREDSELTEGMIDRDSPDYDAGADNDLYDIYANAAATGATQGENQRVMTRDEWAKATPEEKIKALGASGINWDDLRSQGRYSATMPDGTKISGEAIRDFAGMLFLEEGYLPTAPVHEMAHAMVKFLDSIGALTDDDYKALSQAYGEAVAKDKNGNLIERFNEERFANAIEMAMAGQIDLYEKTGAEKVLEKMRDAIGRVVQFFGGMEEDAFWRMARQDAMVQAVLTGDWQGIDAPKNLMQLAERHRRLEEAAKRSRQRRNKAAAPSKPQPPETTTGDTGNVQAEAGAAETGGGEAEGRGRGGEGVPGGEAPAGGEAVATEAGAQGQAPVAKPAKRKAPTTRYGADNKPAAKGRYRIVDGKLIAEVVRNDYRPKLQPRAGSTGKETRARKEQNVAQSADLNPDLLEIDRHMREGAPTVTDFLHPVAGWGRYAQITAAYEAGKGAEYRQRMRELDAEYEDMGYDESMEMPMLVFILDGMPMDELEQLAIDSNQSGVLGHTDVEQAKLDAGLVTDKVLRNLHPNENGDLRIDDNAEALFAFIDGMGAEGAKLRTEGGRPTGEAVTRLRKALLAKALEGSPIQYEVLRKAFDETAESRASRVVSGVVQGAAALATIGNDAPALDISAEAAWALSEYFEFRELNATGADAMENWLGQGDMFNPRPAVVETLLREFWARRLSGASVAAMLGEYARRARAKGADAQETLGEADAGRTKDAILKEAAEATRDAGGADRWAIAGPAGAARLGIGTLAEAKELRLNGADRWQIWQRTGWYVDPDDGIWRIEVGDIQFKVKDRRRLPSKEEYADKEEFALGRSITVFGPNQEYERTYYANVAKMRRMTVDERVRLLLSKKPKAGPMPREMAELLARKVDAEEKIDRFYDEYWEAERQNESNEIRDGRHLGDFLEGPVFDAYPELKVIDFDYEYSEPTGAGASYDGLISLSPEIRTMPRKAILYAISHEIEHEIQAIEGTHLGTSPSYVGETAYMANPGEREARAVEARMVLTDEQKKEIPPFVTKALVYHDQYRKRTDYSYAAQKAMMERMRAEDAGQRPAAQGADRYAIGGVTPAEDAAYMDAVRRGDMETAQRMVREAAAKAMPDTKVVGKDGKPLVVYHDTNSKRYVNRETGEDWDLLTPEQREAWDSRDDWDDFWEEKDFWTFDNRNSRRGVEMPAHFFSPVADPYHEYGNRRIAAFLNIRNPAINPKIPHLEQDDAGARALDALRSMGHDGFFRTEDGKLIEANAFDSNQIKSADPVTYDDAGNVIPLSERFNPNKADIRWAIAVSPGSGPQYGADAYIKAIMASDALANRNRPDADYEWMIDKLTRDGGSVEDYKDDARQLLKDSRAKIAADMIAAGRPGPATRLLAQAAEENAIGSLLADAAGFGMQTGAKYGIKAAEGWRKAWNSLKFGKAALGGVDEAEQTLGIGLTALAEASLGEADAADKAANDERRAEAEANADAAIAERDEARKKREEEKANANAPATETDEEREARIEREAEEAEQKAEGVIADIEAAKRSGEFDKKDDGGAKPKDKNAGEGEKAAAEENAEAAKGAEGRGDDAAPPPPPRISTEALARVCKKHDLDPEDARTMMLMMRIILRNWIIQKSGGKFTKTNVFLSQENVIAYQQTMAKWLRDFASKMVDPSNGHAIRRITDAIRDIQAYDPPPPPGMSKDGVTRAIRHIDTLAARAFSMIQAQAVKDEKRATGRQIEIDIRDRRGRAKRIDDLEEDVRMKMLKDDLKMAQFLEHAIWWTPEAVAIKMREYQKMMDERAAAWAKDGMAGGEEFDTAYRYASMRMTLLAQYGGLVYRSRAEIAEARRDIIDWLDNALESHARVIEQREKAMAHAREDLKTAMRGPTTPKHAERKTAFGRALTKAGDWIVCTMRQRLDLMTERPDMTDEEREAGRRAKRKILQMIAAGSIRRSNLQFQYKNDLYAAIDAAIEGVAGMSRKKFIQHLGEKVDDEVARRISRQGNTGDAALTYGQLLNIYSYLCQTTSYAYNINKHEREGQREYLESVLPTEDLQFVAELRKLYAARFDDLSQAKMDVVGAPLTTPDPLYTPIRMYVGARGGLAPEVEGGWTPVARALWTERVPNGRDVDESRDILALYWESSKDTANAVSFGLRGSMLRSILAHPETVEAMEWAIGKKETRRLLDHLSDTLNGEAPQGTPTTGGEIIKALNSWATYCSLAWNPFTVMKQATSIPAWTGVLDYGSYRRIAASIANFDSKAAGELMAHPGFIARYGAETINPLKLKTLKNIWNDPNTSIRQKLGQLGMQPLQIGDLLPGLTVGTGIYKELVRKYVDEEGMDEAKAREQAGNDVWALIEESQQSSQMQNLMEDMRRGGVISKSLWKFATSPILQASQEVQALREWRRSGWKDDEAKARFISCAVANHILMPMSIFTVNMMAAYSMAKKDPWEDWFKELVVACFIGSYGRWFLIGTGAEAFVRHLAGLQVHDNTSIPSAQLALRLWGKAGATFHDVMSMDFDKVGSDLLDTAAIISPAARIVRSRAKNKAKRAKGR